MPIVIFAICVAIAILLTVMVPSLWPAALAIAIAGSALALAFRSQDSREIGYLTDDITVLQEQNSDLSEQATSLQAEVAKNKEMIDELADIVEQIATLTADGGDTNRAQIETLRAEVADVRGVLPESALAQQPDHRRSDEVETRLAALEAQATAMKAERSGSSASLGLAGAATAATATASSAATADLGNLRSLMARGNGDVEIAEETAEPTQELEPTQEIEETPAAANDATLAPVFRTELGAPVAFILRPIGPEAPDDFSALLKHAIKISDELEEAQRENLLFVRLSSETLAQPTVRESVLAAVAEHPPLQRRLAILTGQQEFNDAALQTLTAIAAEGCRFGMDNVRDWSINLASLARDGMAFILVDGPAMARSANEQGGDPRRLAQALGMHEISLIAGDVSSEQDMMTVKGLEPTFVTGDGLGETRVLEAAS